jgi:hypothetical protein
MAEPRACQMYEGSCGTGGTGGVRLTQVGTRPLAEEAPPPFPPPTHTHTHLQERLYLPQHRAAKQRPQEDVEDVPVEEEVGAAAVQRRQADVLALHLGSVVDHDGQEHPAGGGGEAESVCVGGDAWRVWGSWWWWGIGKGPLSLCEQTPHSSRLQGSNAPTHGAPQKRVAAPQIPLLHPPLPPHKEAHML